MGNHTDGPWWINPANKHLVMAGDQKDYKSQVGISDGSMCGPWCTKPPEGERDANAQLIAAAPDLLEALEKITNIAWGWDGDCGAASIAWDAINKATGASPQ